jgi:hypothetical protein
MSTTEHGTPKKRPFKKYYCDRPETFLLPPIAYKIWMYHYKHEGPKRESWPSRAAICKDCNINLDSLKNWRKWLVDNGWLVLLGHRDSKSGEFKVPVYRVTRGTIPEVIKTQALDKATVAEKTLHGKGSTVVEKTTHGAGEKTIHGAGEIFPPEVDTQKKIQNVVDVEHNNDARFQEISALNSEPSNLDGRTPAEAPAGPFVAPAPGVEKYGETDSQETAAVETPDNSNPDSGGTMSKGALLPAVMYKTSDAAQRFVEQFARKLGRPAGESWALRMDEVFKVHGTQKVVDAANKVFANNDWWLQRLKTADDPTYFFNSKNIGKMLELPPEQKKKEQQKLQGRSVSSNYDTGKTVEDHEHLFAGEI